MLWAVAGKSDVDKQKCMELIRFGYIHR